ncbi:MAG: PHB depolymerase family esterase [Chitinophagaceae bacterium]
MFTTIKTFFAAVMLLIVMDGCKKNDTVPAAPPGNDIIETSPPYQKPYTIDINRYIGGYYEALPNHYQVTTKKYPLLIFLHGGGQTGDGDKDLPLVLNDGVAKEINERKFPANFTVKGDNFSFIVLSPQFRGLPPDSMVLSFINYALKNYRVDSSRIYLSGLSMGGVLTTEMAGLYTSLFAAVAPIAGESFGTDRDFNAENIAHGNLPLWVFHNSDDPTISSSAAKDFISLVNSYIPLTIPKLTIFQAAGHDAWSQALDPRYKENNMNLYEWMLQYKR